MTPWQKLFLFSILLLLLGRQGWTQNNSDAVAEAYQTAIEELVLLENGGGIIPLRRLDTLRLAFVNFGLPADSELLPVLKQYTRVTVLEPPPEMAPYRLVLWVAEQARTYDFFVLGVNDYDFTGDTYPFLPLRYYAREFSQLPNTIVVVIGGKEVFMRFPFLATNPQALLVTPPNEYASSLAAQLIFGAIGARGRLGEALPGTTFGAGRGLDSKSLPRLRFSPPEIVGMNRPLLEDSISAIVEEGIEVGAYPGAQVLVAKNGHIIYHEAFGYHTYDHRRKVSKDDLYDYASVTKISGALPALMRLSGKGQFSIDASLARYLPVFEGSNKGQLTFRHMLAHHAQLKAWIPYWRSTLKGNAEYPWEDDWDANRLNDGRFKSRTLKRDSSKRFSVKITDNLWLHRDFKEKKIYKAIEQSPLNEKSGYLYSGLLFYLLPDIISNLTQTDFETYLKQNIYYPLGAYTITYNPQRYFSKDRIVPTERDTFFRMEQIHGTVHDEGAAMMGGVSSNAGLFSTAVDLAKLMQLYLNEGIYGDAQVITPAAVREFTRCQFCAEGNRRGLGFDKPLIEYDPRYSSVAKDASAASFGHSGYTGTFTWADPQNDLLFIFFSNRVFPTRDNRKIYELSIRPRIHQVLYDAVLDEN